MEGDHSAVTDEYFNKEWRMLWNELGIEPGKSNALNLRKRIPIHSRAIDQSTSMKNVLLQAEQYWNSDWFVQS